jgi:hypothetical protein
MTQYPLDCGLPSYQASARAILKDKLGPPPPGSGLSADTFVMRFQTQFQTEQFQELGSNFLSIDATHNTTQYVTNLQGPPLAQANHKKINTLKRRAQEIAHDLRSCDDVQISYLETLEERDNDNLRLAQMLAG